MLIHLKHRGRLRSTPRSAVASFPLHTEAVRPSHQRHLAVVRCSDTLTAPSSTERVPVALQRLLHHVVDARDGYRRLVSIPRPAPLPGVSYPMIRCFGRAIRLERTLPAGGANARAFLFDKVVHGMRCCCPRSCKSRKRTPGSRTSPTISTCVHSFPVM